MTRTPEQIRIDLQKLQLELEAAERLALLNAEKCMLSNGRLHFNTISFTLDPVKQPLIEKLKNLGFTWNYYDKTVACDIDYWRISALDTIQRDSNFTLIYPDELRTLVDNWKPAPNVYGSYNKEHTYITFDLAGSSSSYPLSDAGCIFHNGYNKFVLNVSLLAALDGILEHYATKYPKLRVELSAEVQADLDTLREKNAKIESITSGDGSDLPAVTLGPITLRNFQVQALEFLKHRAGNGIVALEMGLGKTPTYLAYIDWYWRNVDKDQKFIIIGPASLRPNWTSEVRKYLDETTYQLYNTTPQSMDVRELITGTDYRIFYANFEVLSRAIKDTSDPNSVKSIFPWTSIISMAELRCVIDEAHYLKNPESARTRALFEINFKSTALLTGTPMKNGPTELYSLVRLLDPLFAGSKAGWDATHTVDNGRVARNPEQLKNLLAPIMFRRLKKDVVKDLPPINRMTLQYELTDIAKSMYNQILLGLYKDLDGWNGDMSDAKSVNNMLVEMMRMKQVCSADKVDFVVERAQETVYNDESDYNKVIIFSQFANEPPIVKRIAQKLGHEAVYFTGNDDVFERQRVVTQFQDDPRIKYLVASTKAAQEGLNITAAGHVIFVDFMWSPSDHSQAEGRAYGRIADLHSITSTYISAKGTIDDHIISILMRKLEQITSIIDGGVVTNESLTKELLGELKNLRMLK